MSIVKMLLPLVAIFNPKIKLFYNGRKETFAKLQANISPNDSVIWMHCASLGEFEQGRPVLEKINEQYPNYKILLSFFSPSGYEIRKDYELADVVVYLPLDSTKNANKFLKLAHPELAIFVKYEFWPNILAALKQQSIKTILISGIFRADQSFFTKKTAWFKKPLEAFSYFFVQDKTAVSLLESIGFNNTSLSGDTRFDRVFDLVSQRKELDFLANFTKDKHTLVAGSTWEKDEELLVDYINNHAQENQVFIIAPHNIKASNINHLAQQFQPKTLLYSSATAVNIKEAKVLIIDSIGILTSVYYYANIAYVGGGFGTGIHNILEPATYRIPIIIGPKYQKFKEAKELISQESCFVIKTKKELTTQLQQFYNNPDLLLKTGKISANYVKENTGATKLIMNYITNQVNKIV